MIGRLNHVAIVVPDLAAAAARYRDALGAEVSAPVDLPEHTDGGAVERGLVSVSYLSRLEAEQRDDMGGAESALGRLIRPTTD